MNKGLVIGILAFAAGVGIVTYALRHKGETLVSTAGAPTQTSRPANPTSASAPKYLPEINTLTDPGIHWEERIKAVRSLPGKLGDASADKLYAYLEQPPATGEENWYLVCNEIMEVLRKRNLTPGVYTQKHLALIQSEKANPVIRDYAAQHLAQWISGIDPNAKETDAALAQQAFDSMLDEAGKPENGQLTLAGTTLNALCDAVTTGSEAMKAKREAVGAAALKVVENKDGTASPVNRSSALQVAARLQTPGLPQACRHLATNKQEAVDVRLSAIAALGQIGDAQDVVFLQSMASEEAFKFAAAAAVERLNARSGTR